MIGKDELLETNYGASIMTTIEGLERFLSERSWDGAVSALPIPFPPAGRKKKRELEISPMEESAAVQSGERVKQIRNRCKKLLGRIEERLTGDSQTFWMSCLCHAPLFRL